MNYGPDKNSVFPNKKLKELCFIKNTITRKNIVVGDYTYYDDKNGADKFEEHVTHHYDFIGDKLIIGKFCSIASGIEFIMNGANHNMSGFSTYPFNIFGSGWEKVTPKVSDLKIKGDTVVGNDVWIGQNVTILLGVKIGDGAIIGANSVVASDIPAYSVAVGNPCRVIKKRFDNKTIKKLEEIQWWNWSEKKIFDNLEVIVGNDIDKMLKLK